jgi:hypothetical protein
MPQAYRRLMLLLPGVRMPIANRSKKIIITQLDL